jgi:RND superfamily putative drug exporter
VARRCCDARRIAVRRVAPWINPGYLANRPRSDADINTGIIRSMAGSGSVVTAAELVFAFTMASFIFSDLRVLGQIGTTIALGLMFDTLIVRSFMTPSIAALLGRWFWWPVKLRLLPVAQKFGDEDSRQLSLF